MTQSPRSTKLRVSESKEWTQDVLPTISDGEYGGLRQLSSSSLHCCIVVTFHTLHRPIRVSRTTVHVGRKGESVSGLLTDGPDGTTNPEFTPRRVHTPRLPVHVRPGDVVGDPEVRPVGVVTAAGVGEEGPEAQPDGRPVRGGTADVPSTLAISGLRCYHRGRTSGTLHPPPSRIGQEIPNQGPVPYPCGSD